MKNNWMLLAGVVAISTATYSDKSSAGEFSISVGGFLSTANTQIGVYSPDLSQEFKLDLEDDLNLKNQELLPYLHAEYEFNDKHSVFIDWRRLHRNSTVQGISKPFKIEIEGETYQAQVGARITSTLNIDVARVGYAYTFFEDDDWELDATAGVHVMAIEVGFGGEIGYQTDNDGNILGIGNPVFTDVTAPLPNFGLIGSYQINDDWSVTSHAQFFYIKYQEIRGLLIDTALGFEYSINDDLSLTGAYSYYEVGIDYGGDLADLDVSFQFYGPMLTLNYVF